MQKKYEKSTFIISTSNRILAHAAIKMIRTQQLFFGLVTLMALFTALEVVAKDLPNPYSPAHSHAVESQDTIPLKDRTGTFTDDNPYNPFDLNDPSIIDKSIEYDPDGGGYFINEKIGDDYFRNPSYLSFEEYLEWKSEQQDRNYYQRLAGVSSAGGQVGADIDPVRKFDISKSLIDRLFGGTEVDLAPKGNIDLTFGWDYQNVQNPVLLERQQQNGAFDFDMAIRMNMDGSIGEKLKLNTNYNTQATFDFDRQLKLEYDSELFSDDDILKKIEAGNVSLPLKSTLIQGTQALFGIKADMQFGKLRLTTVLSQQNSEQEKIKIEKGAQLKEFQITTDQYDENRHFFLSHYNRETFDAALRNLPQIASLFKVTKVEVWVTNERRETQNTRNIMALADLGENSRITNNNPNFQTPNRMINRDISGQRELPDNTSNDIYAAISKDPMARDVVTSASALASSSYRFVGSQDFEKVRARQLRGSEYTLHPELGFVSINTVLQPDQVLGIAYEYTYNGKKYQVGELSTDFPNETEDEDILYVKLLKATTQRIDVPAWDLMMKNIYSIGAFNVAREDFYLDVFYEDPGKGQKRFFPGGELASQPLLRLMNLDNLNELGDPQPDGSFDFVPGRTIFLNTGKIMFPVLEPFGSSLANQFSDPAEAAEYTFQQLYDSSVFIAQEYNDLNRFLIRARFKSSASNEYSLGAFNVPEGSVRVTAGGQLLREGTDYDVDYNLGKVRIINEAYINSSIPINVSFENNALFSFNRKTMIGFRADYEVNKNLTIGGTYMHLFERPFTQKVNIGEDPINNKVIGLDLNYSKDAPWLTRLVDKIPLISTKAKSNLSFVAEAAVLKPGHSKAIDQNKNDKGGVLFIDDFEGSAVGIDLRTPTTEWVLASVPQNDNLGNNNLFPESALADSRLSGVNRSLINWYRIETNALGNSGSDREDPFTRRVDQNEIFPNRARQFAINNNLQTFDIHFDPTLRGPYNFDPSQGTEYSSGIDEGGKLRDPEDRWAGIMREIRNTDFQAANIEYVEFWMMNPYTTKGDGSRLGDDGKMYINLGNISEDVLRDSRLFYENGLPTETSIAPVDTTSWGKVPIVQDITGAFSVDQAEREKQDVGFDGLNDDEERLFFSDYLQTLTGLSGDARQRIMDDPSGDNFQHYRQYDDGTGIFERYSRFNNVDGNSMAATGSGLRDLQSSTNIPDREDLNDDNTLNETEAYYQYEIPIEHDGMGGLVLSEFITDSVSASGRNEVWYRFQVPIERYKTAVGSIQDFRSIRFARLYLTGFSEAVTLRFAKFDLVRNQWRKYNRDLKNPGISESDNDRGNLDFDVSSVSIEENSDKIPFNYALPAGVLREQGIGTFSNIQRNEQSLALNMCNLNDGDAVAIYKNINEDFRNYERLRMFVHAEEAVGEVIDSGEMTLFIRMGSDFTRNYYEYEIPLTMSRIDEAALPTERSEPLVVWPEANNIDFPLELFRDLKIDRNTSGTSLLNIFEGNDINENTGTTNKVRIIGNPNLGLIKGIMLGVRNTTDDGRDKCAEVWVNELRLNGLNESGGAAGLARLDMQLADFGRLSLSGNYNSIGWGALDQKVAERSLEEVVQFDAAANLELGKFFGEKSGLKIPFYAQYSQTSINPKFDPYDLDIELKDKLKSAENKTVRDSLRNQAVDFTSIKSYSFTNVRKERTGRAKTPKPWDLSNFSFTYARSEIEHRDPIIESDKTDQQRGAVDYSYTAKPLYIQPFKNLIKKDKLIKFITELNFNPIPNSFAFNTSLDRQRTVKKYRFSEPDFSTWITKKFVWERNYNLNWDFTKSLKFRFNALNNSVIDELNERDAGFTQDANKDLIWENLRNLGRTKDYTHDINLSYTVPLQHFPVLDFAQVRGQYQASYSWNAAALNVDSLGNVIQNTANRQVTGELDFVKLYNKIPYLKKINGSARASTNNRTRQLPNRNAKKDDDKDRDKKEREPSALEKVVLRPLMMLRKARLTYSENIGSVIPGFKPQTRFLGMDQNWQAPGTEFILGFQPDDQWFEDAVSPENDWITDNIFLNQEVFLTKSKKWNSALSIEPFKDFRLEVNWDYNFVENHSEFFKVDERGGVHKRLAPRDVGSYTITYLSLKTLFDDSEKDIDNLFENFENMRSIISQRIGEQGTAHTEDGGEYTEGFGRLQRDVLIPAFIASYTGTDPKKVKLNIFDIVPKPNWQLSYNGLNKVAFFKDIFQSFSLTHGYRNTLSVNSYNTDYDYAPNDKAVNTNDITGNFYSRFEIPAVSITEAFQPLLGLNIKTRNDMTIRVDMNKARTLDLSFTDNQLNENRRTDYVVGFGYKIQNVFLPFLYSKSKRKQRTRKSQKKEADDDAQNPGRKKQVNGNEMELRFDFSFSDNASLIHRFDTDIEAQASRGTKQIRISPAIDYDVNDNLTLTFFFDYNRTEPKTSRSYPITNINSGLTVRFSLE